jgi:hypothetical protein
MDFKLITAFTVLLFSFNLYSQIKKPGELKAVEHEKILRSYFNAGLGITHSNLNYGTGLFFPIGKNILIGPRANANFEINVFETPAENMWDIDLEMRYVPLINRWIIFSAGAGVGYSTADRRGKFIRYDLVTAEYEKVHSSSIAGIAEIEASLLLTKNFGVSISAYTLSTNEGTFGRFQLNLFLCKILDLVGK